LAVVIATGAAVFAGNGAGKLTCANALVGAAMASNTQCRRSIERVRIKGVLDFTLVLLKFKKVYPFNNELISIKRRSKRKSAITEVF
jgi:hypothetical protein